MAQSRRVAKIKIDGWQCERCRHQWVPRTMTVVPEVCPRCKSPYWSKPRKTPKQS